MTRATGTAFKGRQIDPAAVHAALGKMEEQHKNAAWAAILGGFFLCLATALVLSILYFLFSGLNTIGGWPFKVTFFIVLIVCLPAMFLLAANLQRGLPEAGGAPAAGGAAPLLADRDDGTESPVRWAAERANMGPRLVLWGVRQVRGRSAFGVVPHDRLVAALVTLATADAGISPAKLLLPGESADQLEPLLGVLLHHDLADLSKNADRVWITTDGKRKIGLPV